MKIIISGLILVIFTLSGNGQSKTSINREQSNPSLVKAKRVQTTGVIMTLLGSVATVGGSMMMENGLDRKYPSTPGHITGDTYSTMGGYYGILLVIVGVPLICIGVPTFIVGGIHKYQIQKNLQLSLVNIKSPVGYSSVTGIGLKIRF